MSIRERQAIRLSQKPLQGALSSLKRHSIMSSMKHAFALILLSCGLVAQDKTAVESPKPPAATPSTVAKIMEDVAAADAKRRKFLQSPVNIRNELIELIHQMKEEATVPITPPADPDDFGGTNGRIRADIYIAKMKAKTDAQNTLLQALVELSKLPEACPAAHHSECKEGAGGRKLR
jgi:hypothetical protein